MMTEDKKKEFTRRISQANPTDMVVVIYDIALDYAKDAENAAEKKDTAALSEDIVQVRRCINELIGSLNYGYSPAGELLQLYRFCLSELTAVTVRKDAAALARVESILSRLRDAYDEVAKKNNSGPVMENAQSVYAGLTYGRGTLNEDIVESGNRGYRA